MLTWPKSIAASGPAISYQLTISNRPLLSIPGQTTAVVTSIHHSTPSVYRVIATDSAGKVSEPSKALVVLPSKRPPKLPKTIPRWAFDIFGWQQGGRLAARRAEDPSGLVLALGRVARGAVPRPRLTRSQPGREPRPADFRIILASTRQERGS